MTALRLDHDRPRVDGDRADGARGALLALMREQLSSLRTQDGLVYAKLARRIRNGFEEVLLFEEWRDTSALYGWAGPELTKPVLLPGSQELVEDVWVTHYEALDMQTEE